MQIYFDHEKLHVYQAAIAFVAWCDGILHTRNPGASLKGQFERAASSIALNIAEGNGKTSARDRCRFLEMARGSSLECAACLDVLAARNLLTGEDGEPGKRMLLEIVRMLTGLMSSLRDRVAGEEAEYDSGWKEEEETEEKTEKE